MLLSDGKSCEFLRPDVMRYGCVRWPSGASDFRDLDGPCVLVPLLLMSATPTRWQDS